MDFKRFAQVFYNLTVILRVVLAQLNDLISEDVNTSKAIKIAELNPIIKFKLRPFEDLDDHFYYSDWYMKFVKCNKRKILEKFIGFKGKRQPGQRRTGHQGIFKLKKFEENTGLSKGKRQLNWDQSNRTSINFINKSSEISNILGLIREIHNQIKKLKTLPKLLTDLRAELQETEKCLILEIFENLLKFLEKNISFDEAENKIKMAKENRFKEINNHTCNTQYQIENLFILNRLSEENNLKLKGADAGIFKELTACKMKDLLEKAVSNLNGKGISQGDIFAVTQASLQENQMDYLEQLRRNFLKMFHSQNVTLKNINQMSKIVDFVERYHGTVSDLKTSSEETIEDGKDKNTEGSDEKVNILQQFLGKRKKKVLVDDGFDIFRNENVNEKTAIRKKNELHIKTDWGGGVLMDSK